MGKTTVVYKDVAVGAAEAASVTATGPTPESAPAKLPFGQDTGAVVTLEHNRWILDGSMDRWYEDEAYAFWSAALSGADGSFDEPPTITIAFSQQFSSMGVSFSFDTATGEYCSALNIKWYQGDTLKADQNFAPDSAQYFCEKKVESYDKLVITVQKTSLPYRRAKINQILFGIVRIFGMEELRNTSIVNEMDEAAIELPVSSFSWTLDSLSDVEYMFQLKQPVEVRSAAGLLGVYYISSSSRQAASLYDIKCNDALGVLSETQFAGGAYLSGVSAKTLLSELAAPFAVEYADGVEDVTLKGLLLPQTRREAIQQVLFSWGVCLATDGGSALRVFQQDSTAAEIIPKDRTFTGAAVDTAAVVTKVSVTAHTYTVDSGGSVQVGGVAYKETTTVYTVSNPNVTAGDRENVKEITGATLVSTDIGQAVANRVYAYYAKRDTATARIVHKGEKLGDCLSVYTPWGTLVTGNLHKMEIKLSNTVVYGAEVTG